MLIVVSRWSHFFPLFLIQVDVALTVAERALPDTKLLLILDQAPSHMKKAPDALNVKKMNVSSGGSQTHMRDGWYTDADGQRVVQRMDWADGTQKGLQQVLIERGLFRPGKLKEDLQALLASQPDFLAQMTLLQELVHSRGHLVLHTPKFHPELSPIESVWAAAKSWCREHCYYTIAALRETVPQSLDRIPLTQLRNYFEKADAFAELYAKGFSGEAAHAEPADPARASR